MDEGDELTLTPTAFDHIIERPRLITALEQADARVVLFCAPAGYGKTTLARQWSARQSRQPVWYRTTRASGDVAALAVGLDNLLAGAGAPKSRDPKRIASIASVNPRPEPLARALVSTYKRLPKDLLLVVDEYEAADTAEAEELFGALVDGLPIRFLFTSRRRPRWFEPRLTVYGEAVELGMEELTMTDEEAETVLELGRRAKVEPSVLDLAQGWPAVLGLAAMTAEADLPQERLLPRALYDFLATEMVDSAPEDVRDALSLLAVASVGSVNVAALLLGNRHRRLLDEASQRGLVVVGDHGEFAIHPLLRELLLVRLRAGDRQQEIIDRLQPLVKAHLWDEALAAAEAMPAPPFVSYAFTAAIDELLREGRMESLRRWVQAARAAGLNQPLIDYAEAELAYRGAEFDRAFVLAGRAANHLDVAFAARAHLCAARAAHLAGRDHALEHARAAQALATEARTRAAALWAEFTCVVDNESEDARDALAAFAAEADDSEDNAFRLATGSILVAVLEGGLAEALDDAEIAWNLIGRADPLVECAFLSALADHRGVAAEYEKALEPLKKAVAIAKEYEFEFVRRFMLVFQARAMIGLRRILPADRALSEAERLLKRSPDDYIATHIGNQRAGLYLSIGDPARAQSALTLVPGKRVSRGPKAERLGLLSIARATMGDAPGALEFLAEAEETSRMTEFRALAAVARAVIGVAQGNDEHADAAVVKATQWNVYHPLVLGLRASPRLARVLAARPEHTKLLTDLLMRSNDATLARKIGLNIPRSTRRTDRLSPRELEIHELIAQGLTNREIAKLLFISPSTAKVHVHHVLEKLGVRSRVEAARLWEGRDTG